MSFPRASPRRPAGGPREVTTRRTPDKHKGSRCVQKRGKRDASLQSGSRKHNTTPLTNAGVGHEALRSRRGEGGRGGAGVGPRGQCAHGGYKEQNLLGHSGPAARRGQEPVRNQPIVQ